MLHKLAMDATTIKHSLGAALHSMDDTEFHTMLGQVLLNARMTTQDPAILARVEFGVASATKVSFAADIMGMVDKLNPDQLARLARCVGQPHLDIRDVMASVMM